MPKSKSQSSSRRGSKRTNTVPNTQNNYNTEFHGDNEIVNTGTNFINAPQTSGPRGRISSARKLSNKSKSSRRMSARTIESDEILHTKKELVAMFQDYCENFFKYKCDMSNNSCFVNTYDALSGTDPLNILIPMLIHNDDVREITMNPVNQKKILIELKNQILLGDKKNNNNSNIETKDLQLEGFPQDTEISDKTNQESGSGEDSEMDSNTDSDSFEDDSQPVKLVRNKTNKELNEYNSISNNNNNNNNNGNSNKKKQKLLTEIKSSSSEIRKFEYKNHNNATLEIEVPKYGVTTLRKLGKENEVIEGKYRPEYILFYCKHERHLFWSYVLKQVQSRHKCAWGTKTAGPTTRVFGKPCQGCDKHRACIIVISDAKIPDDIDILPKSSQSTPVSSRTNGNTSHRSRKRSLAAVSGKRKNENASKKRKKINTTKSKGTMSSRSQRSINKKVRSSRRKQKLNKKNIRF